MKPLHSSPERGLARRLFPVLRLLPLIVTLLLGTGRAEAYPWMIKHGYTNCATCHSDPSGGELLTGYGRVLSQEVLSTQWKKPEVGRANRSRRWALTRAAHSKNAEDVKSTVPTADPNAPADPPPPGATDGTVAPVPDPNASAPVLPGDGTVPPEAEPGTAVPAPAPLAPEPSEPATPAAAEAAPDIAPEAAAPPPHDAEGHEFFQPFFGVIALPDTLLLGGSIRLATLYRKGDSERVFPMQLDLYGDYKLLDRLHIGGSIGAAKVGVGSPYARRAQVTRDQGAGYNLISRTHYLRFDFGDGAYSVSAGRLNLPFGLRISEHTAWVRSETITDRESSQEHGAALNMNFQDWRFEIMAIAGNYQVNPDEFRKRGYSGYVEVNAWDGGAVGVSSLITHSKLNPLNPGTIADTRQAHGAFLRASLGHELVLLAEADLLLHTQKEPGYVGFSQLDYEIVRGVHAIGTGEVLDADYPKDDSQPRVKGVGKPKFGGWLGAQWFFISHFDVRVDAIFRQEAPVSILGQLHVYL